MSDSRVWNMDWLKKIFNSAETTTVTRSSTISSCNNFLATKPLDIKCTFSTGNDSQRRRFVSLQRLDSVGGVETDQPRFSYPPTKKYIDYQIKDIPSFHWYKNVEELSVHPESQDTNTSTSGTWLKSMLLSYLPQKLIGTFTSMPEDLNTVGLAPNKPSSMPSRDKSYRASSFNASTSGTGVDCFDIRNTLFCNNHIDSKMEAASPTMHDCSSKATGEYASTIDLKINKKELSVMNGECSKETQKQSHEIIPVPEVNPGLKDHSDLISVEIENIPISLVESKACSATKQATVSLNNVEKPRTCTNPIIAHIMGYDSDFDSESDVDSSESSSEDEEEYVSFSAESDVENVALLDHKVEENDYESDTDSEELCPYDRIIFSRTPWTCSRSVHQRFQSKRHHQLSASSSDYDSESDSPDDNSNTPLSQTPSVHEAPVCLNSAQCFTDQSVDSCFEEIESQSYSSDEKSASTMKPLSCTNSHISFIMGFAESNSDSEIDEDGDVFSFSSKGNIFSNSGLISNETSSEVVKDALKGDSLTDANTPSNNESCELWDYFMSCSETFPGVSTMDSTKIRRSSSEPILSKLDHTTEVKSGSCTDNTEVDPIPYREPTKVKFCDKVVVHPIVAWAFAYKQARKGPWECFARDRERFKQRTKTVEQDIGWCFDSIHRMKIHNSRLQLAHGSESLWKD